MPKALPDLSSFIQSAAQRNNVDPALVRAVVQQESSGDPAVKNMDGGGQGAFGAMQVRQAALADYNKANGTKYAMKDLLDPQTGINVGTWYLGQQLNQFNDPVKALIAYKQGAASLDVAKGQHPYASQVMARLGAPASAVSAKPATLPGIPTAPQQPAQDDDSILAVFSKGGSPAPQASGGAQSDDAILSAFTKGGATAPASVTAASAQSATPAQNQAPGKLESFGAGLGHGFGSIVLGGQQLLGKGLEALGSIGQQKNLTSLVTGQQPQNMVQRAGQWLVNDANAGLRKIGGEFDPYGKANPISAATGDIAGAVAPSLMLGGGGLLSKGAQAGGKAAQALGLGVLGTRVAQLGGTAAGSAGLGAVMSAAAPVSGGDDYWSEKAKQIGTGAAIGAVTPAAALAIGKTAGYAGNLIAAPFRPFTEAGRQKIAQDILKQYAEGGATNASVSPIGRPLTLAESTGNPGIATLQRTIRDLNPNQFVAQEQAGASQRLGALERITGTPDDLAAAQASRTADAADAYLSTHVGIPTSNTEYAALKKMPAFQKAFNEAQNMAKNAGAPSIETVVQPQANAGIWGVQNSPKTYVSGQGLQNIKQALDDQINSFAQSGEKGKAANVLGVKNKLLSIMDDNIDGYAAARAQFSEASRPIDAMQYLQSKNFTDSNGNVTAAKVDQIIKGVVKEQSLPGIRAAKSVSDDQLQGLINLRDDLRFAGNTGLGRSAGSSTAQNLATQQMVQAAIPGRLGALASQLPSGTVGGAVGGALGWGAGGPGGAALGAMIGGRFGRGINSLVNTQNEAIQSSLANMLLNSPRGLAALQSAPARSLPVLPRSALERLAYPTAIGAGTRSNGQ